jgi:hypothetical protein
MAGAFQSPGKNALADGIAKAYVTGTGAAVTYELVAVVSTTIVARTTVAFTAASTGVIDITGNVTLTIPSGNTISSVYLLKTSETVLGNAFCYETLTTDNAFPAGGDLIITKFEITVT